MQVIGILISILVLIWFWTRFLNQVFSRLAAEKISKWGLLLWGGALVFLLFIYEKILSFFGLDHSIFFIRENITIESVSSFLGYGFLVVAGLTLVFKQFNNKKIWLQIFIGFFSMVFLALAGKASWLGILILYTILAASTEEIFKFTLGNNQSASTKYPSPSTLLLFSLLIGFSFSIVENGLAFVLQLLQGSEVTTGMIVGRGLLASLIHIVATGSIALIMVRCRKIDLRGKYTLALLLGFTIHICYNLSLHWGLPLVSILLAIGGWISLSYLIFHLDEVYE